MIERFFAFCFGLFFFQNNNIKTIKAKQKFVEKLNQHLPPACNLKQWMNETLCSVGSW